MSLPPFDQSVRDFERHFQVVLPDSVGQAALGFRDGMWFRLTGGAPHVVPIRSAIILCPHAAGSIVQIACWWMRENARAARALDLATELALTMGELARKAIEDDPLGMSLNTMSGAEPSLPPTGSAGFGAPATGYGSGSFDTSGYPAQPTAPAYAPSYASGAALNSATTMLPPIQDGPPYGRPGPAVPRQGGQLAPLPGGQPTGGSYGAPGPRAPYPTEPPAGFGAPPPRGGRGPMPPSQRPPAPGQYPGPDPRSGRPTGGPPRSPGGMENTDPRGEFFRGDGPPPPRRPEPREREQDYNSPAPDYGRPPSRPPRPEPGQAW
jgi:hypothetical protein